MAKITPDTPVWARCKRRLRRAGCLILALFVLLLGYAIFIEPRWLDVTQTALTLPHLPPAFDEMTIVQLGDLHYGPFGTDTAQIRQAVRRANAQHPDLIVLTGDYVTGFAGDAPKCARLLSGLHARYGVIAVLGNHDLWIDAPAISAALRAQGITVLRNQAVPLRRGAATLWIAGLDDAWRNHADYRRTLRGIPAGEAIILLAHEPDMAILSARYPIDVQLSGHSHGGQIRLPWLVAPLLPPLSERFPWGLHQCRALQIYTTRGVGMTWPLVMRFNCRPEVSCFTLHAVNARRAQP